jgi:hypothetical protein
MKRKISFSNKYNNNYNINSKNNYKKSNEDFQNNIKEYYTNQNQKFNIDLFSEIKDDDNKSGNKKGANIYLNFYNKHTKNQVLKKENEMSKKFLDNNKEYIKAKQEKFKQKKELEEKLKKQKEKEDTNEYRKEQMKKLYKVENIYAKEINKRKNKSVNKNKYYIKTNKIINNVEKNKEEKGIIKLTKEEYEQKMDSLIKQTRIYLNELEKLPIANKNNKIYEKEHQLNKNIDELQEQLKKYKNLENIEIIK